MLQSTYIKNQLHLLDYEQYLVSGGGYGNGNIWHEEQKISTDAGSLPATLPKVDSAFHSPDGVGKMSSRT